MTVECAAFEGSLSGTKQTVSAADAALASFTGTEKVSKKT